MKSKKFIWILGPGVIIVWGLIFLQIKKAVSSPIVYSQNEVPQLDIPEVSDTTTYSLHLNYDDPFLKNSRPLLNSRPASNTNGTNTKRSKPKKPVVKKTVIKKPVKWPEISYRGMIKNKHQNTLYLVDFEGSSKFLTIGEDHNNIKLEAAYRDSIQLTFQNEKRTILKQ